MGFHSRRTIYTCEHLCNNNGKHYTHIMVDFDPKELLNSKRIFKSATPKYDLSWYVKWIASVFVLIGMSVRGVPDMAFFDMIFSTIGVGLWLWVAILWQDRALILLNGIGLAFLFNNLIRFFAGV